MVKQRVEYAEAERLGRPFRETGVRANAYSVELRENTPPFYPLFYRTNGRSAGANMFQSDDPLLNDLFKTKSDGKGLILYPPHGRGRYYRSEVLAAIAWCETFPWAVNKLKFLGAQIFTPHDPSLRPFAFVQDLFDLRVRIVAETNAAVRQWKEKGEIGDEPYNLQEKTIKLDLNSIYGKMAQSLGNPGILPVATNPFYAGAITAGCRAQLHMGMLRDPWRVIAAATDAILSAGPMRGLEHTNEKLLGTWEHADESDTSEAAIFVHPGFNSFFDLSKKEHTRMRGCKVEFGRVFLSREVRKAWKQGCRYYVIDGHDKDRREVSYSEWCEVSRELDEMMSPYPEAATQGRRKLKAGVNVCEAENIIEIPNTSLETFGKAL
jgi:hypothetical protein